MSPTLESVLERKRQIRTRDGFAPVYMPSRMFPHQAYNVEWAVETGRTACLADCGLGKSGIESVCAENFLRHTNEPVMVCVPPSVAPQWIEEAASFGVEAKHSRDGTVHPITVTSWTLLHRFDPNAYGSFVGDESGCIKDSESQARSVATEFMRKKRYRLLGTATSSPNNYVELGTHSEALGYLGFIDMMNRFFINDQNNSSQRRYFGEAPKWRFRGHAELPFFRYVCSWARAYRKPSDLGFSDDGFVLPPLFVEEHLVASDTAPEGCLFAMPASRLPEQRREKRRTLQERCEYVANLVQCTGKPYAVYCQLNDEGDLLEKLLPDVIQVAGKDEDARTEKFEAFRKGQSRGLITKSKLGGYGMNWQHCAHVVYFPSHSYEDWYQSVRRFYRFGQKNPVKVDLPLTEGEKLIMANLRQKSEAADKMFTRLVELMHDSMELTNDRCFIKETQIPQWLA